MPTLMQRTTMPTPGRRAGSGGVARKKLVELVSRLSPSQEEQSEGEGEERRPAATRAQDGDVPRPPASLRCRTMRNSTATRPPSCVP